MDSEEIFYFEMINLILLNLIKGRSKNWIHYTCVLCANKMSLMHPLTNEPFYVAVLKRCNIYINHFEINSTKHPIQQLYVMINDLTVNYQI